MRQALAIAALALLCAASPAAAQTCIDLCSALPNCGFDDGFDHWTCTRPNGNYQCPPGAGPELDVPGAISPGPDDPFVGVLNPGDQDIAGKLAHDAVALPYTPEGTCFEVKVWGNRGRLPDPTDPFTGRRSQLAVRLVGWKAGARPVIDPRTQDWSRRPNAMSCSLLFPFPSVGSEGQWLSHIVQCTVTQELSWVSMSIAGVNHTHDSYVGFDVTPADFVP